MTTPAAATPGEPPVRTIPSLGSELLAPTAEGHYFRARQLRANAYLSQARALWSARLVVLALAVVDLALTGALLWLSSRSTVVPYVVEVDPTGRAVAVGPATPGAPTARPAKAVVVHALQLFFTHARTVTADRELQRRLLLDAYAYAGGRAVSLLNEAYRRQSPFALAERMSIAPQVTSVLALTADESAWQVQWSEAVRGQSGTLLRTETWQATATISIEPPTTAEELSANPFGIRVTSFDWIRLTTDPKESIP